MKMQNDAMSILCLVLLLLALPLSTFARQARVDVCHLEGNGNYHLITIAERALRAHSKHGDLMPGDDVPGMPGYIFDDACDSMLEPDPPPAVVCPCDFSNDNFFALGGNPDSSCVSQDPPDAMPPNVTAILDFQVFPPEIMRVDRPEEVCGTRTAVGLDLIPLMPGEELACEFDLLSIVDEQSLQPCD